MAKDDKDNFQEQEIFAMELDLGDDVRHQMALQTAAPRTNNRGNYIYFDYNVRASNNRRQAFGAPIAPRSQPISIPRPEAPVRPHYDDAHCPGFRVGSPPTKGPGIRAKLLARADYQSCWLQIYSGNSGPCLRKRAAEDKLLKDGIMHPDDAENRFLPPNVKTYKPADK